MKASEMTDEELAKQLMSRVPRDSGRHDDLREAAARLRLKQQSDGYAAALCRQEAEYKREICDLRRRLQVAEDARMVPASRDVYDTARLVVSEFEKAVTRRPDGLTVIDCECSRLACAVEELKEALRDYSREGKR